LAISPEDALRIIAQTTALLSGVPFSSGSLATQLRMIAVNSMATSFV
jgi:hypothetical protein